jgi:hypothetical protein
LFLKSIEGVKNWGFEYEVTMSFNAASQGADMDSINCTEAV